MAIHGKTATLSLDGNAITAYGDSIQFSRSVDNAEVTTFGDDDKVYIAGLNGATLSVSGPWSATVDGYFAAMQDGASVLFDYSPDGGTTSYTGSCFLDSYSPSSPVAGRNDYSASLTVTGAVTRT